MANRLAKETSPYLLQHAHNPVDWYPWGPEAFAKARLESKPILLSVGYSACHWCHVMERESFEDEATARVMNDLFVNVKVDREERPDVDSIYMQAVQAMNGHGGWPMTVFLTPALEPFWGGTYFPPVDRPGMPSFQRVLHAVAEAYGTRREDVQRVAGSMREMYAASMGQARSTGTVSAELLLRATRGLLGQYDRDLGGFGDAPKFPQAMAMEFLLQQWARSNNEAALDAARHTFLQMARGGIHDQIGGGFSRYSVDAQWLVPHFEKMLYDNALLLRVGTHLVQAVPGPDQGEIAAVCRGILEWLARDMTSPAGGFYSTLDADSEGHEGKFYVWSEAELRQLLGDDADAVLPYWSATTHGNFEGANILHVASGVHQPPRDQLERARTTLFQARAKRVHPARDDKILAAWNGLMLRAVAEAARVLHDDAPRALAIANAQFLVREMVRGDRVFRSHKDGVSRIAGFLEDYAAVGLGMLAVYELTFDVTWLHHAERLAAAMIEWFWDDAAGAFFDTARDQEELVTRPRDITDNATPSGTSLATELLLRLGDINADHEMIRRAHGILETLAEPMARYPLAFGHALTAADIAVFGAVELALAGTPGDAGFVALERVAGDVYVPSLVLAGGRPDDGAPPLLRDRPMRDSTPTAYVCRGYACDAPTTDPRELFDQLWRASRPASSP
ncbi:MAG TPA: thioredoxin domain-containing protein [Gemmatimonadaceae bacterium]|nr:thioredoxin domain-containing protein [Gemmatimonadaceae bacterium]